jgi:hypothetical protein
MLTKFYGNGRIYVWKRRRPCRRKNWIIIARGLIRQGGLPKPTIINRKFEGKMKRITSILLVIITVTFFGNCVTAKSEGTSENPLVGYWVYPELNNIAIAFFPNGTFAIDSFDDGLKMLRSYNDSSIFITETIDEDGEDDVSLHLNSPYKLVDGKLYLTNMLPDFFVKKEIK